MRFYDDKRERCHHQTEKNVSTIGWSMLQNNLKSVMFNVQNYDSSNLIFLSSQCEWRWTPSFQMPEAHSPRGAEDHMKDRHG